MSDELKSQDNKSEEPMGINPEEEDEGLYGWKFHRGPLLAAVVLTVLFYIFVFLWVD